MRDTLEWIVSLHSSVQMTVFCTTFDFSLNMTFSFVNLTGLRDVQRAGETLFLGMSIKMFPECISIQIGEHNKTDGPSQFK